MRMLILLRLFVCGEGVRALLRGRSRLGTRFLLPIAQILPAHNGTGAEVDADPGPARRRPQTQLRRRTQTRNNRHRGPILIHLFILIH